jgi:hypothetical protein
MKTNDHVRQGDLLFIRVDGLPDRATLLPHRILAEGEATGHSHRVEEETAELYDAGVERFLHAIRESLVVHEEHGPVTLGEGWYRVIRQREYTGRRERYVRD